MRTSKRPIVALVYDFDGTLSPGNMQEFGFIQAIGKKPQEFWQESDDIASGQDASNILSYMKLMFDEARKAGIKLRREDFKRFGASVELYDGVLEWFSLVNEYGKQRGVKVEHYINSSGLTSMIEGTPIAKEYSHVHLYIMRMEMQYGQELRWIIQLRPNSFSRLTRESSVFVTIRRSTNLRLKTISAFLFQI